MPENQEGNKDSAVRSTAESSRSGRIAQLTDSVRGIVEITFRPSGISGLVAAGTYVADAARRLGIRLRGQCRPQEGLHFCQFSISEADDYAISPPTAEERRFFADNTGLTRVGQRLGCQARFERPCTIEIVMPADEERREHETASQTGSATTQTKEYLKTFAALPLEQKIGELVKLEAITFADTLNYILNAPFAIGDKILTALATFGRELEQKEAEATRPREHVRNPAASEDMQ